MAGLILAYPGHPRVFRPIGLHEGRRCPRQAWVWRRSIHGLV